MPSKTIKIEPGTCSPPPITVDPPIVRINKNNTKLKFKNDLVAVAPAVDPPTAMVTFYDINDKGGSEYEDFCDGYPGAQFPVPTGGAVQCDPSIGGQFSYTVTATDYQDLDPVIIIEPQISTMTGGPQPFDAATPSVLMAAVGLVVGLVSGYMLGKR